MSCGKCKAWCPPNCGKYKQSKNIWCFYVERDTEQQVSLVHFGMDHLPPGGSVLHRRTRMILEYLRTGGEYERCYYCIPCFQKHRPARDHNEANNICTHWGIGTEHPLLTSGQHTARQSAPPTGAPAGAATAPPPPPHIGFPPVAPHVQDHPPPYQHAAPPAGAVYPPPHNKMGRPF